MGREEEKHEQMMEIELCETLNAVLDEFYCLLFTEDFLIVLGTIGGRHLKRYTKRWVISKVKNSVFLRVEKINSENKSLPPPVQKFKITREELFDILDYKDELYERIEYDKFIKESWELIRKINKETLKRIREILQK